MFKVADLVKHRIINRIGIITAIDRFETGDTQNWIFVSWENDMSINLPYLERELVKL